MARERADNHTKDLNHQVESAQRWKSSYTLLLAKHQALTNKADMELKDRLLDGSLPSSQPPVAAPPERSTGPFMPTRILDREAPRDKTMLNEFGTQSYHQGPSKMLNDEFYSGKQGLVPIPAPLRQWSRAVESLSAYAESNDNNAARPKVFKSGSNELHRFATQLLTFWRLKGKHFQYPESRANSLFSLVDGSAATILTNGMNEFGCRYESDVECMVALWNVFGDSNPQVTADKAIHDLTYPHFPNPTYKTEREAWSYFRTEFEALASQLQLSYTIRAHKLHSKLPTRLRNKIAFASSAVRDSLGYYSLLNAISDLAAQSDFTDLPEFLAKQQNRSRPQMTPHRPRKPAEESYKPKGMGRPRETAHAPKSAPQDPPTAETLTCHICGKPGHFARECPESKKSSKSGPSENNRYMTAYPDESGSDYDDIEESGYYSTDSSGEE